MADNLSPPLNFVNSLSSLVNFEGILLLLVHLVIFRLLYEKQEEYFYSHLPLKHKRILSEVIPYGSELVIWLALSDGMLVNMIKLGLEMCLCSWVRPLVLYHHHCYVSKEERHVGQTWSNPQRSQTQPSPAQNSWTPANLQTHDQEYWLLYTTEFGGGLLCKIINRYRYKYIFIF